MEDSYHFTLCYEDAAGANDSTRMLECHKPGRPSTYYLKDDAADIVPTAMNHVDSEHSRSRIGELSSNADEVDTYSRDRSLLDPRHLVYL